MGTVYVIAIGYSVKNITIKWASE